MKSYNELAACDSLTKEGDVINYEIFSWWKHYPTTRQIIDNVENPDRYYSHQTSWQYEQEYKCSSKR